MGAPTQADGSIVVGGVQPEHVTVEYLTTGFMGGDSGHGGRTEVVFRIESGVHEADITLDDQQIVCEFGLEELRFIARGDWEKQGLDDALKLLGLALLERDLCPDNVNWAAAATKDSEIALRRAAIQLLRHDVNDPPRFVSSLTEDEFA